LDCLADERSERQAHTRTPTLLGALEREAALDRLARPSPRGRRKARIGHVIHLRLIASRDDGAHARWLSGEQADHRFDGLVRRVVRDVDDDVHVVARKQDLERLDDATRKDQAHGDHLRARPAGDAPRPVLDGQVSPLVIGEAQPPLTELLAEGAVLLPRYPDEWVALVQIDSVNENDLDFHSARVAGHGKTRKEPLDQARPLPGRYDEIG